MTTATRETLAAWILRKIRPIIDGSGDEVAARYAFDLCAEFRGIDPGRDDRGHYVMPDGSILALNSDGWMAQ